MFKTWLLRILAFICVLATLFTAVPAPNADACGVKNHKAGADCETAWTSADVYEPQNFVARIEVYDGGALIAQAQKSYPGTGGYQPVARKWSS